MTNEAIFALLLERGLTVGATNIGWSAFGWIGQFQILINKVDPDPVLTDWIHLTGWSIEVAAFKVGPLASFEAALLELEPKIDDPELRAALRGIREAVASKEVPNECD